MLGPSLSPTTSDLHAPLTSSHQVVKIKWYLQLEKRGPIQFQSGPTAKTFNHIYQHELIATDKYSFVFLDCVSAKLEVVCITPHLPTQPIFDKDSFFVRTDLAVQIDADTRTATLTQVCSP